MEVETEVMRDGWMVEMRLKPHGAMSLGHLLVEDSSRILTREARRPAMGKQLSSALPTSPHG